MASQLANGPLRILSDVAGKGLSFIVGNSDQEYNLQWTLLTRPDLEIDPTVPQEGFVSPQESTQVRAPPGEAFIMLVRRQGKVLGRLHFDEDGVLQSSVPPLAPLAGSHAKDGDDAGSDCCICLKCLDIGETQTLRCSHKFHENCISTWLAHHNSCPLCRTKVTDSPPPTPQRRISSSSQLLDNHTRARSMPHDGLQRNITSQQLSPPLQNSLQSHLQPRRSSQQLQRPRARPTQVALEEIRMHRPLTLSEAGPRETRRHRPLTLSEAEPRDTRRHRPLTNAQLKALEETRRQRLLTPAELAEVWDWRGDEDPEEEHMRQVWRSLQVAGSSTQS